MHLIDNKIYAYIIIAHIPFQMLFTARRKRCMLRQFRPSVRQTPVLCQNEATHKDAVLTIG